MTRRLKWEPMQSPLPGMQVWGARSDLASFIISYDASCIEDDRFYRRYSVSAKMLGSATNDLGQHDTLAQAQAAAEASRA
ncbi:hypothetical protein [Microvirga zambiensis]|uniref:hypothetical protein n=1 Tax=Microvirga zambiensis TaxID=1402137 RepID=UPI00191FAEC7|nr:hypothetical protein [Microvirga zambiensis]